MRLLGLHGGAVPDDAQAFAAAEQQKLARARVRVRLTQSREGDARPLVWRKGIKMGIAWLERVRGHCRERFVRRVARIQKQHHSDEEGARGLVANLNVGVEERHVPQPLAQGDALVYEAEHMCVRAVRSMRVCVRARLVAGAFVLLILVGRRTKLVVHYYYYY